MPIVPVTDLADPRLAAYREMRERDLVGRQGRFVAEGDVVLRTLLSDRSRFAPESLLVASERLGAAGPLIASAPPDCPVFVVPRAALAQVAGFPIHRGLLGIGRRGDDSDPEFWLDALPADPVVVVLVGLANHDNVGGVFRNAAAFGAAGVLIDGATCDPLYRKAIRVSVGAALTVPFVRCPTPEGLLTRLVARGFALVGLTPSGEHGLADVPSRGPVALVLGTEGPGLPAAILDRVRRIGIPMVPGFDSLNVATASGIALHALAQARGLGAGPRAWSRAADLIHWAAAAGRPPP